MPNLKIAICQMNPDVGDIEKNTKFIIEQGLAAYQRGIDVIIFPEMSTVGYYPGDLLSRTDFRVRAVVANQAIISASKNTGHMHWVFGTIDRISGRSKLHNKLMIVSDGRIVATKSKELLPTYGVHDELRHFEPGSEEVVIIKIEGVHVGFLICEEAWTDSGLYNTSPLDRLINAHPDVIVSINSSPSNLGKMEKRLSIFKQACQVGRLSAIYVNQVGGQDQVVYDGGSFLVEDGHTLMLPQFIAMTRDFFYRDNGFHALPNDDLRKADTGVLESAPEGKYGFFYKQILLGTRDYARRCGFKTAIIGSSGGIDSAITLGLAADALGPENVLAVTMPSYYSSEGSVSDSVLLCQNLGIKLIEHSIQPVFDSHMFGYITAQNGTGEGLDGLARENIQARIRGTILMGYSNQQGYLLLTTGNKSEIAVGFCTLYGDTNGGLGLIGDAYKTEVFDLSKTYNLIRKDRGQAGIPEAIIEKPPSAELAPDQKDIDSLPPYPVLDAILKTELEGEVLATPPGYPRGFVIDPDTILKVKKMIARSEYKRRQAPPIIKLRPVAFGADRQIPITAKQY